MATPTLSKRMIPFLFQFADAGDRFLRTHAFEEAFIYLLVVGLIEAAVLACAATVLAPVAFHSGLRLYGRRLSRLCVFAVVLLAWGCAGNQVWCATVRDHLYVNPDSIVEFIPFIPPGRWVLDEVCGGHLVRGATFGPVVCVGHHRSACLGANRANGAARQ